MVDMVGFRPRTKEDYNELMQLCDENMTNSSSLMAGVLSDWLHSRRSKKERGDITLAAEILKNILKNINKKQIKKIAETNAEYVLDEMKFQADELDFEEISKRILEWNNKENDIRLVQKQKKESIMFMQRHHMGFEWSQHQCLMYTKMFEMIGETMIPKSIKYDKNSFSFEIIRHQ